MLELKFWTLKVKLKPEHLTDFKRKLDRIRDRPRALPKEKRIFPKDSSVRCTADYVRAYYSLNGLGSRDHFESLNHEPTTWPCGEEVEFEELELEV